MILKRRCGQLVKFQIHVHQCRQADHVARNCTHIKGGASEIWSKSCHTSAQCWTTHPKLTSEALVKKRQQAIAASARKPRRVGDHFSPSYQLQGMVLTYKRQHGQMDTAQRRSAQVPIPIEAANEAVSLNQRGRFTPSTSSNAADVLRRTPSNPTTSTAAPPSTPAVAPESVEKYTTHLPQTFPHGLPTSSLVPGTPNELYPPTSLFPKPSLGGTESLNS